MRAQHLGTGTGGVWTAAQTRALLSAGAAQRAVARGEWQRLLPGVFTDAGHVPDVEQQAWAAVLASDPGALACMRTAARLWGLPLIDDEDPATGSCDREVHDVAVRRNVGVLRAVGATVHRHQLSLDAAEVTRHPSGLALTTPGRTIRDLAAVLTPQALVCAVDDALRRGLLDVADLETEVVKAKGTRHVRELRSAVESADAGAATPAETLARVLLRPLLPGLRCQVPLRQPWGELVAVLDLADEELRLAVEVDGKRGHAGAQMVAKDRRRDRRTEALGWRTERVTWFELRRRQPEVVQRVLNAAARCRGAA